MVYLLTLRRFSKKKEFITLNHNIILMIKSVFQIERAKYAPKMPKALAGPVKIVTGGPTDSVADQKEIKKLFPGTYGMPIITFEE